MPKANTWRFIGTLDTMLIAWIVTGNPISGFTIGVAEIITKMILYYLHERAWYQLDFGIKERRNRK